MNPEALLKLKNKLLQDHANLRIQCAEIEGAVRLIDMLLAPVPDGSEKPKGDET